MLIPCTASKCLQQSFGSMDSSYQNNVVIDEKPLTNHKSPNSSEINESNQPCDNNARISE